MEDAFQSDNDMILGAETPGGGKSKSILRFATWSIFAFFCLFFFTILKLPEVRLKNYLQGTITQTLAQQGVTLTSESAKLSIGLGISYEMTGVNITPQQATAPLVFDRIRFSPALLQLMLGKLGGNVELERGQGEIVASFSAPVNAAQSELSVSFKASQMDLGKLGVFSSLAGIQGSALLTGEGNISGNLSQTNTLKGEFDLKPRNLNISPQSLSMGGFALPIPQVRMSDGEINVKINQGRVQIQKFRLGKPGSSDDFFATVNGEVNLSRYLGDSNLNLRTRFGLSDSVKQALVLVDTILGVGKQPDGSYAYRIGGTFNAPAPQPGG